MQHEALRTALCAAKRRLTDRNNTIVVLAKERHKAEARAARTYDAAYGNLFRLLGQLEFCELR